MSLQNFPSFRPLDTRKYIETIKASAHEHKLATEKYEEDLSKALYHLSRIVVPNNLLPVAPMDAGIHSGDDETDSEAKDNEDDQEMTDADAQDDEGNDSDTPVQDTGDGSSTPDQAKSKGKNSGKDDGDEDGDRDGGKNVKNEDDEEDYMSVASNSSSEASLNPKHPKAVKFPGYPPPGIPTPFYDPKPSGRSGHRLDDGVEVVSWIDQPGATLCFPCSKSKQGYSPWFEFKIDPKDCSVLTSCCNHPKKKGDEISQSAMENQYRHYFTKVHVSDPKNPNAGTKKVATASGSKKAPAAKPKAKGTPAKAGLKNVTGKKNA